MFYSHITLYEALKTRSTVIKKPATRHLNIYNKSYSPRITVNLSPLFQHKRNEQVKRYCSKQHVYDKNQENFHLKRFPLLIEPHSKWANHSTTKPKAPSSYNSTGLPSRFPLGRPHCPNDLFIPPVKRFLSSPTSQKEQRKT